MLSAILLVFVVALLYHFLATRYRKDLRAVPGPFLASFLPLDRLWSAYCGNQYQKHQIYHQKYGSLVRVGPNHVSFSDGKVISQVYGITSQYRKSDFYRMFDVNSDLGVLPTIFSVRDEQIHKSIKRPVANAYSMTSLIELEPLADQCSEILLRKLDGLQGREIDLGRWLQWYAFDVISSLTFSHRLGFMEREEDISGIIRAIEGRLGYNSVIGQAPALHDVFLGNKLIASIANNFPAIARLNASRYISQFAAIQLKRYQEKDRSVEQHRDMLARFKRIREDREVMSDQDLLSHASGNIFAGSDTTAISLRALLYHLCKQQRCLAKLIDEIDTLDSEGGLSNPVTYAEANQMQYLQACVKEAMRMHPAVGQLLERVVPRGGATISDVHLHEGTVVGINPWVAGRDPSIYGPDSDIFRPERWQEADPATLKLMDRNFLAFGTGARTCLGKNVSLLEMSKLVPQLLRAFTIELTTPDFEWELVDHWFVRQKSLLCRVSRRQRS